MTTTTSEILKIVEALSKAIEIEEKLCEQRITFFLTISTATIGAVNLLYKVDDSSTPDHFFWTMFGVLISLFIYGKHTLNRINWRYINIQIWRRQMINAFQELSNQDPFVQRHIEIRDRFDMRIRKTWIIGKFQGSPAEFMYITNALIYTGIWLTLMLYANWRPYDIILICLVIFVELGILLWAVCQWLRKKFIPKNTRVLQLGD